MTVDRPVDSGAGEFVRPVSGLGVAALLAAVTLLVVVAAVVALLLAG
jgi:hypothetical protein